MLRELIYITVITQEKSFNVILHKYNMLKKELFLTFTNGKKHLFEIVKKYKIYGKKVTT